MLQWCGVVFQYHDHYAVVNTEKYWLTEAMVGNYCVLLQWYETIQIYTVTTPLHIAELLPLTVT